MRVKTFSCLTVLLLAAVMSANAAVLATFTDTIAAGDPTMLGRISRSGVPSDWTSNKAFPGVVNTTTTYYYDEYLIPLLWNSNYFQIEIYDPYAAVFAVGYLDSFTPAPGPTATHYLGDAGASGTYFGGTVFFQVFVPTGHVFDLVINSVGAGLDRPFDVMVEGFADTMYTEPTPEPASAALMLGGVLGILAVRKRLAARRRSN